MGSGGSAQAYLTAEEATHVADLMQVPSLKRRVEEWKAGTNEQDKLQLEEEAQDLSKYLKGFDRDLKGSLSKEEFREALGGSEISDARFQAILAKLPQNSEGHLDFLAVAKRLLQPEASEAEETGRDPKEAESVQRKDTTTGASREDHKVDQEAEDEKEAAKCRTILRAAEEGNVAAARHFLRTEPGAAMKKLSSGITVLHRAAIYDHAELCQVLLAAGAEIEAKDEIGNTPLHWAAIEGRTEAAKALLEANASVAGTDGDGDTPLHDAARNGHAEVVQALLEAKASVAAKNNDGKTPVDWAREKRKDEVVQILEQVKETKDVEAESGTTPGDSKDDSKVYAALISGHSCSCLFSPERTLREIKQEAEQELGVAIRSLIGPNMEPVNEDRTLEEENVLPGTTLTVVAVDQQAEDEKEAAKCDDLFRAAVHGNVAAVRHFLRTEPRAVVKADRSGNTALHFAAGHGHAEVCRVLLAAGVEIEAKTKGPRGKIRETPLHLAAASGYTEAVKALLKAKASVASTNIGGSTPLHEAARSGRTEAVKALLEAKASVAATNKKGKTPVDLARREHEDEVVQILEQATDAKGMQSLAAD